MKDNKFFLLVFLVCLILVSCYPLVSKNVKVTFANNNLTSLPKKEYTMEDKEVFKEVFQVHPISDKILSKIYGHSWKEGCPVKIDNLRYLEVTYWGFDDKPHIGELIVNEKIADEVKDIFNELYFGKYPIDKIKLIDDYNANDDEAMLDNNTSAFCYRVKPNSAELSVHSFGMSIDINPVQNPYIKGSVILPSIGHDFLDRTSIKKGMIAKDDLCYKAFTSRGWTWGGDWKTLKDYQHFEKN